MANDADETLAAPNKHLRLPESTRATPSPVTATAAAELPLHHHPKHTILYGYFFFTLLLPWYTDPLDTHNTVSARVRIYIV